MTMARESPTLHYEKAPQSAQDEEAMMAKKKTLTGKKISLTGSSDDVPSKTKTKNAKSGSFVKRGK